MSWCVARTKPNHELIARRKLRAEGITVYCPKYFDDLQRRRRLLFPSYIFIKYTRMLMATLFGWPKPVPEVFFVLLSCGEPHRSDELDRRIRELKQTTVNGLVVLKPPPEVPPELPPLKPGDTVVLNNYLDAEHQPRTAIYQGMSGSERIAVMLGDLQVTVKLADTARAR